MSKYRISTTNEERFYKLERKEFGFWYSYGYIYKPLSYPLSLTELAKKRIDKRNFKPVVMQEFEYED